jgi:hypothetical protein
MTIAHFRAKAAAERYKAQLRARGEKLTIAELIPLPPTNAPMARRIFSMPPRAYQLSNTS